MTDTPGAASGGWKLWIKRRDVEEADYSAVDGLSPELTVDELKRRWVADKKLDLDSSLVKLYRVKDSPGKPTDTEDLAALIKERLLHDPSLTLFDAGVRDRCWLLAEFVQVTATKLSFVQLLAQGGIQRPNKDILRLIELHFATQASVVSDSDGALHLYRFVQQLPGTRTKAAFAAVLGIHVGGPLFPAHTNNVMGLLLSGSHISGKSVVVKVLYAENAVVVPDIKPAEVQLCEQLALAPWDAAEHDHFLVRATAVCMNVDPADEHVFLRHGNCWAIIMPRYTATLGELGQLSLDAVAVGCTRMCTALDFIHSRGLVHADVKSANVLVTSTGAWLLSDFGSCVKVETPLKSTTELFHATVRLGTRNAAGEAVEVPATTKFDWQLMFCMLLMEAFKVGWRMRLVPPGWDRVSGDAMHGAYNQLLSRADTTEELRSLARELNARAYTF